MTDLSADEIVARVRGDSLICLSVDTDWSCPQVLADIVRLLDQRNLSATFFCTSEYSCLGNHERALHPNFRRDGDTVTQLRATLGDQFHTLSEDGFVRHVLRATRPFAAEARGVRAHSLFFTAELLSAYTQSGLEYQSNDLLPFVEALCPYWKSRELLELPIYYMDHVDMIGHYTDFALEGLRLNTRGMKVFDFHPNMVYINAPTDQYYRQSKPHYHDPDELRRLRHKGSGVRTLFIELLDTIVSQRLPTTTLGALNDAVREHQTRQLQAEPSSARKT